MKNSYYFNNRLLIGNRRECTVYIKYFKPIWLYTQGIYNPYKQCIKINGVKYYQSVKFNYGDYIEIGDIAFRVMPNILWSNSEIHSLSKCKQYSIAFDRFVPLVHDIDIQMLHIEIERYVEEHLPDIFSQIIPTVVTLLISTVMSIVMGNFMFAIVLIFGNSIMVGITLFQVYRHYQQQKQLQSLQQKQYNDYLLEIMRNVHQYFKKYTQYEQAFQLENARNLFSRSVDHQDYLSVVLGKSLQQQVMFHYKRHYKEKRVIFDETIENFITYYQNKEVLYIFNLQGKIAILNNKYVLEMILAQLLFFHHYSQLKIKYVGNFDFKGNHFEKITLNQVEEDSSLYIFDCYYDEIKNLKLYQIVLCDAIYDYYDEILEEKENGVYLWKKDVYITTNFNQHFDQINAYVNQFQNRKKVEQLSETLWDVQTKIEWGCYDVRKSIVASLSKHHFIDFHEAKDGPHALIAGMTGSGKSELLQAIIVSLCLRYSSEQLNFVIIDYKGSSFASKVEKFPHIIGVMDNLNTNLSRCIKILKQEVHQRQIQLQTLQASHIDETNIPHLFIVCDEFAELKKEHPEFIDDLVSISRIGRSLGIHLILATQKPSGIVSDEILNNANLKIALKLLDRSESIQLIGDDSSLNCTVSGEYIVHSSHQHLTGRCMYVNAPAKIVSKKQVIINKTKILNAHQEFGYTQRDYFMLKMPKSNRNIFRALPTYYSDDFMLVDELNTFKQVSFTLQNTLIYGDVYTGKTETLKTIIAQINQGVVYYIYEDEPFIANKVINISITDIQMVQRLVFRLLQANELIIVVIDHFELLKAYEFYEHFEQLFKQSQKNNQYYIVSMREELPYFMQIYFNYKLVLYYETSIRKDRNEQYSFHNEKIPGRVWIKNKEAQIGYNVAICDYIISGKYQLVKQEGDWEIHQFGFDEYTLERFKCNKKMMIVYTDKEKLNDYLKKLKNCCFELVRSDQFDQYEMQFYEYKLFIDIESLTRFGDYTTVLNDNEIFYIGLRKKFKLII